MGTTTPTKKQLKNAMKKAQRDEAKRLAQQMVINVRAQKQPVNNPKRGPPRRPPQRSQQIVNLGDRNARIPGLAAMMKQVKCNYCRGLIAPFAPYGSPQSWKVPRASKLQSFIYRSKQTIDVQFNTSAGADSGRFACLIQPKIGSRDITSSGDGINAAKVLVTNGSTDWSGALVDWASSSQYDANQAYDPAFDDLNGREASQRNISDSTGATAAKPFGTNCAYDGGGGILNSVNLGVQYDSTTGGFSIPPGRWILSGYVIGTGITTWTALSVGTGVTLLSTSVATPTAANTLTTTRFQWIVDVDGPEPGIVIPALAAITTIGSGSILFHHIDSARVSNDGVMEKYTVHSMAALATFVGNDLTNGGNIAAAYLPPGVAESKFMQTSGTSTGNYQYFDQLAEAFEAYNGPIKNGAYVWWNPADQKDREFNDPQGNIDRETPTICIAGTYQQPATPYANGVIRITIWTNYEILTSDRSRSLTPTNTNIEEVGMANKLINRFPHAMTNKNHLENIKNFFRGVGLGIDKFFDEGTKAIGKYAMNLHPAIEAYTPQIKELAPLMMV